MPDAPVANPIGGILSSLPMEAMFCKPLMAALDAHTAMCVRLEEFIVKVGFNADGTVKMTRFAWSEPQFDEDGKALGTQLARTADVPFLSIIPMPALAVNSVDISFELEVNTSESSSSSTEAEGSLSGTLGWGWFSASFSAKVSHKSEQTRKTDTRAKYSVNIKAGRVDPPEALMRIIDAIVDGVTKPVPTAKASKDANPAPAKK